MLVLSRQRDETIMIGDSIELTVVDIRGDKVRLGIQAPADIAIHRKEVYEAIRGENLEASRLPECRFGGLQPPASPRPRALAAARIDVRGSGVPEGRETCTG